MGNRLKNHLLLFLVLLLLAASVTGQEHKSIASLYVDQAITSYERGEIERAYELLLTSLSFMPDNSDSLYLLAKLDSAYPAGLYSAEENCRKALSGNSWRRFAPLECRVLMAELLVRTGQFDQAESVLRDSTVIGEAGSDYYFVTSKTLSGNNKTGEAIRLLEQAVRKYPEDPRLKQLLLKLSPVFRKKLTREYLEGRYSFDHNETVLLDLIRQPLSEDQKKTLIDLYIEGGGDSPWMYIELIELADEETDVYPLIDALLEHGGMENGVLIDRLLTAISGTDLYDYFFQRTIRYTGRISYDSGDDGYQEILHQYEEGLPRRVTFDLNQDGLEEYDAVFADGLPVSVTGVIESRAGDLIENERRTAVLEYSDYPYAEKLVIKSEDKTVTYSLPPGVFSYPLFDFRFLENPGPLNRPRLNAYRPQVTETYLRNNAVSMRVEYAGSNEMVELWEYLPGQQNWQKKELDAAGRIVKRIYFKDGMPVQAGVDSNRDGDFEVTHQYDQGNISAILFDENGDTIPEYSMVFGNDDMRSWDFNGDSVTDCREVLRKDGTVLRLFSSAMDGVFDMEFLYDKNRILWVSRNGLKKMVKTDTSGRFSWVGDKPPAELTSIPPAGVHAWEGYTLSVFNQFGHTYVEVLK